MRRWLALALGVMVAAFAAYAILTSGSPERRPSEAAVSTAVPNDIDDASRARLEAILSKADSAPAEER